jgi:hypothetical protein
MWVGGLSRADAGKRIYPQISIVLRVGLVFEKDSQEEELMMDG